MIKCQNNFRTNYQKKTPKKIPGVNGEIAKKFLSNKLKKIIRLLEVIVGEIIERLAGGISYEIIRRILYEIIRGISSGIDEGISKYLPEYLPKQITYEFLKELSLFFALFVEVNSLK